MSDTPKDNAFLGGKAMNAIEVGGKIYVAEPDVRRTVNAALATNSARNARIAEIERELATLREKLAAAERLITFGLQPTIDALTQRAVNAEQRAEAAEKDSERLDWLESKHTLHGDVEIMYVVDGYDLIVRHDGNAVYEHHGNTFRAAIDAAQSAK